MLIDATTLFDLLRLVVNRTDEKVKRLADAIFEVYNVNSDGISPADVKYCELYVTLCKEIIGNQLNVTDHKIEIVNIFKRHLSTQIFKRDAYIREALNAIIDKEITPVRIVDITKRLNNIVQWHVTSRYVNKMYSKIQESKLSYSLDDRNTTLNNVKGLADEFRSAILDVDAISEKGGPVEVIDMSNKGSIRDAYKLYKERRVTHVLKTGLQGLNKMFGGAGGMGLGESILFPARTHHFKSGMLMKMVQWIAAHNTPPKTAGKKPMILLISLENEGYQNMIKLFQHLYVAIHGVMPPFTMSDDDMVDVIYDYFSRSEYTLVIERYLPSQFGYDELVRLIEKYENSGFRVAACILDYIAIMKTHNYGTASKSGDHALLQELCNNVVNYFKAVGTTLITAVQLNRDAANIAASGMPHPVKSFSERHIAGSMGVAREFDFIAYLEITKDEQGNSWLTMAWGKHRYVDNTMEIDKFCAYKFDPVRGIIDDINGPFMGSRNIYAKANAKEVSASDINDILGITV